MRSLGLQVCTPSSHCLKPEKQASLLLSGLGEGEGLGLREGERLGLGAGLWGGVTVMPQV